MIGQASARDQAGRRKARSTTRSKRPKGEIGFYIVSDGTHQPVPLPRAAAVVHQPAGAAASWRRAICVADLVALIGTIDIVLGEVDR